ncbi:glycoside hydrolase family 15 protein [Chelativorans sp. M5D2P16]|uniref:glycoside hydrolase family 15 protein n=1 Tax=Chelativorans sp. M5D2P16 TaxID=3095678 RepID=UPI002ACA3227|nr:glycoside hydrolase family 15 protein [Chelativorans sp. M5D2P16]MDZ5696321.1 glycoside hydrolase family 15 protein [Chelativorans sp. M5D2P16]
MSTLNLGAIGNCSFSALIDPKGRMIWCCLPRFDGDPVFNALLAGDEDPDEGHFSIVLEDLAETEQHYEPNTAVLVTRLHGASGSLEIVDTAPRFFWRDRIFRPQTLVRRVRPIAGTPRISIRMRPTFAYGTVRPQKTRGSNHVRYVGPDLTLRLSTDAPIDYVLDETFFNLSSPVDIIVGPDETLDGSVANIARDFEERTASYWHNWVSSLALPFEWQEAVIRAAITLKLCTYEPTGAIIAAMTTSIPEAPDSGRNWDYRFCWVRDAFFVVRALNSLGTVQTMENYFRYLMDLVADTDGGHLQPVFGIGRERQLTETILDNFAGYRGMGPVRYGNQAFEHYQHDVYGNVILGAAQIFFDRRIQMKPTVTDFRLLETAGEQAYAVYNTPDAGMWELRSRSRVHTSSSLMCWAACDRLAHIASRLGEAARATQWRERADEIKACILAEAWSEKRKAFVESFGGDTLDASVLLMTEVGFIDPRDPRFVSTVDQLEKALATGPYMLRYEAADDFGKPEVSFNICAFWRLDALARIGRHDEAREIFEALLKTRNPLGMLSEDTHPVTGEMWGNYPQTYSMVGIINGARRLSKPWETVV